MKIIHVVESFAGGVYDFIQDLVIGMPNDFHVIVYATREHTPTDFKQSFPNNVSFIPWSQATREINPKQDFKAYRQLVKLIQPLCNVIDVIHLHSSKAGFLGRIVARQLQISDKVVYTPHGVSFLRKDVSNIKHNIFVMLEKIGAYFGGTTVACSKSEMEEFHSHNISASYINNGYNCTSSVAPFDTNKTKLTIGTIGRVSPQKNPVLFNEIASEFFGNTDISFLWIGDGELANELESKNIMKTGWLSRREVDKYLKEIDIYLSTSLWEGLPLSVLQAMCAKKPLILSDCVGNRDLVKNNYNGMLFRRKSEAVNYINTMIEEKKIVQFGTSSREYLQQYFTLEEMIENYYNLYQKITQSK